MRKEKNGTRYFGFDEIAKELFNLPPYSNDFANKEKKASVKEKFETKNICKTCKQPLTYIGGNILCCANPECKGNKSYWLMDEKQKHLAQALYGESGVIA